MGSKSQNGLEIISYFYICLAIYNESSLNSQSLGSQFLVSRNFEKGMGQTMMKNGYTGLAIYFIWYCQRANGLLGI